MDNNQFFWQLGQYETSSPSAKEFHSETSKRARHRNKVEQAESKQLILPCSALSSCKASSDIKVIGICMRTHLFTYNSFYYLVSMTLWNSQTLLHDWTDESMLFANFIWEIKHSYLMLAVTWLFSTNHSVFVSKQ